MLQRSHPCAPPPPSTSLHRIPRAPLVLRDSYLRRVASGRRVIHLGFVDKGRIEAKRGEGTWLHHQLADVASDLIGLDADQAGIEAARAEGYEAYTVDVTDADGVANLGLSPADVLIAGELIEHVDDVGLFLEAVKPLVREGSELVLTTPNATALTNVIAGVIGVELVNEEHVGWHSWRTLTTLLRRHDWKPRELAYYRLPRFRPRSGRDLQTGTFNVYQTVARPLFYARPSLADGLIMTATR